MPKNVMVLQHFPPLFYDFFIDPLLSCSYMKYAYLNKKSFTRGYYQTIGVKTPFLRDHRYRAPVLLLEYF